MKISKSIAKIVAACGERERYGFHGMHVAKIEGVPHLAATNGKIAVFRPIEDAEADVYEPKTLIPKAAVEAAGKAAPAKVGTGKHAVPGTVTLDCSLPEKCSFFANGERREFTREEYGVPDTEAVLKSALERRGTTITVAIDGALLATLQRAMDADGVTLQIDTSDVNRPIIVRALERCTDPKAIGIIMPIGIRRG